MELVNYQINQADFDTFIACLLAAQVIKKAKENLLFSDTFMICLFIMQNIK